MRAVPALLPAKIFPFACYSICLFRALFDQSIDQPFQEIRTLRLAVQNLLADFIGIRQRNIERLFGECHQHRKRSVFTHCIQNRTEILQSGKATRPNPASWTPNSKTNPEYRFYVAAETTTDARPVHSKGLTPIRRFVWLLRYNGKQIPHQHSI